MTNALVPSNPSEFLIYQTDDGQTRIQVRVEGETVWLTQRDMAELFQTTKQNVSLHIQNIYGEGELMATATVKKYLTVQTEGARQVERDVEHYNLDVIISVGYRVKSLRGTQFRIWATQRLREYIIKGFSLDDQRLKEAGGGNYFDELLDRIRDIRSSERVFWRKVLDIYATSIDYDAKAESSQLFFKTVQNKMHWAAHGKTAAEVVHARRLRQSEHGPDELVRRPAPQVRCEHRQELPERRRNPGPELDRLSLPGLRGTAGPQP